MPHTLSPKVSNTFSVFESSVKHEQACPKSEVRITHLKRFVLRLSKAAACWSKDRLLAQINQRDRLFSGLVRVTASSPLKLMWMSSIATGQLVFSYPLFQVSASYQNCLFVPAMKVHFWCPRLCVVASCGLLISAFLATKCLDYVPKCTLKIVKIW